MTDSPRRRRLLVCLGTGLIASTGVVRGASEDVGGSLPPLAFRMQRANGEAAVSEDDIRGSVVLLYFGYTTCPDVCPTTLANVAAVLDRLGALAARVRVLFVTVGPARDTPEALRAFTAPFGPAFIGLRPSPWPPSPGDTGSPIRSNSRLRDAPTPWPTAPGSICSIPAVRPTPS